MKYINQTIKKYTDDLSSDLPAPGGGSAAALVASTGVSLLLMVANFTKGKKACKDSQDIIKAVLKELGACKKELDKLIDEDVKAYGKVANALKMPKNAKRKKALERALKQAARVPFRICEISKMSLEKAPILYRKGNRNLLSDVACGVDFLKAAYRAAKVNVNINLKYIEDKTFRKRMSGI